MMISWKSYPILSREGGTFDPFWSLINIRGGGTSFPRVLSVLSRSHIILLANVQDVIPVLICKILLSWLSWLSWLSCCVTELLAKLGSCSMLSVWHYMTLLQWIRTNDKRQMVELLLNEVAENFVAKHAPKHQGSFSRTAIKIQHWPSSVHVDHVDHIDKRILETKMILEKSPNLAPRAWRCRVWHEWNHHGWPVTVSFTGS